MFRFLGNGLACEYFAVSSVCIAVKLKVIMMIEGGRGDDLKRIGLCLACFMKGNTLRRARMGGCRVMLS